MDRGLCWAPVACTLLILGIGLQLNPLAEVIQSFGPFALKESNSSELTKNTSKPEEPENISPVSPSSAGPAPSETLINQYLDSASSPQPTNTAVLLSTEDVSEHDILVVTTFSAQPTTSMATSSVLSNSLSTTSEMYVIQTEDPSTSLVTSLSNPSSSVSEQSKASTGFEFLGVTETYLSTENIQISACMDDLTPSSEECSSIFWLNTQLPTFTQSDMITEDPFVISSSHVSFSMDVPVSLQSSVSVLSETSVQDVTSISTKSWLKSIYSSIGLFGTQDSSTSPYMPLLSTLFPPTSMVYEISSREVPVSPSSLLMTSEEVVLTMFSSPVPSLTHDNDQTLALPLSIVSSKIMHIDWETDDFLDTMSITPSGSIGQNLQPTMVSEKEFFEESKFDLFETVFPSRPMVHLSSMLMDSSGFSSDLTNLIDTSLVGGPMTTILQSHSVDLNTHVFSVVDSANFMSSLSDIIFSATASVDLEPALATTEDIFLSTPSLDQSLFEPVKTVEAPAFVPTESVQYFNQSMFPLEESGNISFPASTQFSAVLTLEPSSPFSLFEEQHTFFSSLESGELSALLSQDSPAMLATSELFLSSPVLEPFFTSAMETIEFEGSGLMPWQTSIPDLVSSLTLTSTDEREKSSSIISESSELWEATSILQSESSFLYTSSFTGANSTVLPLFLPSASDTAVPELSTSLFDHASSALVAETLQNSLLSPLSLTSWLWSSMSSSLLDTLDDYALVPSVITLQTLTLSITPTLNIPTTSEFLSTLSTPLSLEDQSTLSVASTLNILTSSEFQSTLSEDLSLDILSTLNMAPTLNIPTTSEFLSTLSTPLSLKDQTTLSVASTLNILTSSEFLSTLSEDVTLDILSTLNVTPTLNMPATSDFLSTLSVQLNLSTTYTLIVIPTLNIPATSDILSSLSEPVTLSVLSTLSVTPTINTSSPPDLISTLNEPFSLSMSSTFSVTPTWNILSTSELPSTLSVPSNLSLASTDSVTPALTISPTLGTHLSVSMPLSVPPTSSTVPFPSPSEPVYVATTSSVPTSTTDTTVQMDTTLKTVTPEATTAARSTPRSTTTTPTPAAPITPPGITATTHLITTRPTLLCDVTSPEPYLVTAVLFRGANIENVTESIKEFLTLQFNRSVELEVYALSPGFSFMVTSGPFVYTSIAVENVLSYSSLLLGRSPSILSLQTAYMGLDQRFHVQTVLQFVPQYVDIRLCTFSEQIQRGLSLALYEVRRLRQESDNFTVQIVNITSSMPRELIWKAPVTVSYAVRDRSGFLNGSDVSDQLRNLSLVEFSFFLGFPVKQIAEPSRYPQLNVSPLLKDSWLRTVLLGVMEQRFRDEAFQAEMERKLALLFSEATSQKRRWKRASFAGGSTVQVVNVSRMDGSDDPVQLIYFIEDQYGERLAADKASSLINEVNIQRAAIILGYRVQGVVAQPLNQAQEADRQAQNLWIIVGVAVPVLVVTIIIVILYWKLCRTDKLDFQPDTMSNLQQRQKLQAPSVKGFDFAKQHLGQHNKDEVLVVHEPPPPVLHGHLKDSTPSENGDVPSPKSKGSSKPPKVGRHRGSRVTPSDAGSTASDASSGKESVEEEITRPSAPPRETNLRPPTKGELPSLSSGNEQHSSASIFEHVDRMSRSSEASRRLPSKIQLIAMQPIAAPPMHGLSMSEREMEANKINREIQTTLRHKSEIEHHRNKIRLRAKRKGHYEFPLVDVVGITDTKERQRMYRKAQMQFDKILEPVCGVPTVFIEPRKSSRARRSPKQRRRQQGSGSPPDADRDRLITTDSDGTYKRPPGVSNSAYVSDPDLPSDNPTPSSDPGKFQSSPQRSPLPAQYVAPQPSIEEVRQTMQSLLDDAFALVAPGSQGVAAPGTVQTGGTSGQQPSTSTPARTGHGSAPWAGPYPSQTSHFNRFVDYGITQASAPSHMTRSPGFGSGFLPPAEMAQTESQQTDTQFPARGMYPEDMPSVARPRPLGSTAGSAQIHQLTQVGIASRMGAQATDQPPNRAGQAPVTGPGWSSYYHEEETPRNAPHRDPNYSLGTQDYGVPQMFVGNRGPTRQPLPSSHLQSSICYPSGSAEDFHPGHSSASLIKAIREELLRLSQKQAVVPTYHS
ncbi:UPF0606 protein KIAA1549 homolog [Rhinophrynus dorsalis]